jgi:hypothetical protein
MQRARVGAQGEQKRRLRSTVLRTAAVELDERAAELSEAVVTYIGERLPQYLTGVSTVHM